MTLKIEVFIPEDEVRAGCAARYLASALGALGFSRAVAEPAQTSLDFRPGPESLYATEAAGGIDRSPSSAWRNPEYDANAPLTPREDFAESVMSEASVVAAVAKRVPGQPSPGKARRTKAEIAEDEAAAPAEQALISTGENRVDPDQAEDPQDAADEAAESVFSDGPTLNDLRAAMGAVQRKHGMAVAAKLPGLIGKPLADLTDGEIPGAISSVNFVLENGISNVSGAPEEQSAKAAPATKQDLVAAMLAYALFADGQNTDHAKMPNTMKDIAFVFSKLFGADVTKLSQVPADGYDRALAGVGEMHAKNQFKRGAA